MAHKVVGYKKLKKGYVEVIFSKKEIIPSEKYEAILWMSELNETIRYLKSLKRTLNMVGIRTKNKN